MTYKTTNHWVDPTINETKQITRQHVYYHLPCLLSFEKRVWNLYIQPILKLTRPTCTPKRHLTSVFVYQYDKHHNVLCWCNSLCLTLQLIFKKKSPPLFYIVTGEFPLTTHILILGFIYNRSWPQFRNQLSHELKVEEKRLSRFLTAMWQRRQGNSVLHLLELIVTIRVVSRDVAL